MSNGYKDLSVAQPTSKQYLGEEEKPTELTRVDFVGEEHTYTGQIDGIYFEVHDKNRDGKITIGIDQIHLNNRSNNITNPEDVYKVYGQRVEALITQFKRNLPNELRRFKDGTNFDIVRQSHAAYPSCPETPHYLIEGSHISTMPKQNKIVYTYKDGTGNATDLNLDGKIDSVSFRTKDNVNVIIRIEGGLVTNATTGLCLLLDTTRKGVEEYLKILDTGPLRWSYLF